MATALRISAKHLITAGVLGAGLLVSCAIGTGIGIIKSKQISKNEPETYNSENESEINNNKNDIIYQ